jgi:serine/threonine protein kinase
MSESGKFLKQYYLIRKLGGGAFGEVYSAGDVVNNQKYAVKILRPTSENVKSYTDEVHAHQVLSQVPNCARYVACLYESGYYNPEEPVLDEDYIRERASVLDLTYRQVVDEYYYLVTELMDGDLNEIKEFLHSEDISIHPNMASYLVLQMLRGLSFIHNKRLAHKDIKPENILYRIRSPVDRVVTLRECLMDETCTTAMINLELKYADLGFTCTDRITMQETGYDVAQCKTRTGSALFLSPELVKLIESRVFDARLFIAQSADVWALGVTIYELFYGKELPFFETAYSTRDIFRILSSITNDQITTMLIENPVPIRDPALAATISNLLKRMLRVMPYDRISASSAVDELESVL